MRQILVDLRRAALLAWVIVRHVAAPAAARLWGADRSLARLLRQALERLGVAYLKVGQYVAVRHDIFPPAVCREMDQLFESAAPVPAAQLRAVLESELGAPVESLFHDFRWQPIGSASIAQVHEALLHDGRRVAVKVQRPGIAALFDADVRNLRRLAWLLDLGGLLGTISVREIVEEFSRFTRNELDFILEGETADRLRREITAGAVMPEIHWELTTRRVLVMEFIDGISMRDVRLLLEAGQHAELAAAVPGFDLDQILDNLSRATLHQLFVSGFFHGDPHPGNILVLPGNRVAFVDFGIFGELTEEQRATFVGYTENLVLGDVAESFRHLERIYEPTEWSDPLAFRRDACDTLGAWYRSSLDQSTPIRDRHLGKAFDDMVVVVTENHYRAAMDYLLFWRALIVLDSIALSTSPDFDLIAQCRDFFTSRRGDLGEELLTRPFDWRLYDSLLELALTAPERLSTLLADVRDAGYRRPLRAIDWPMAEDRRGVARPLAAGAVAISLALLLVGAPELGTKLGAGLIGTGLLAVAVLIS